MEARIVKSNLEYWICPQCNKHIIFWESHCPFCRTPDTKERMLKLYPFPFTPEQLNIKVEPIWESNKE